MKVVLPLELEIPSFRVLMGAKLDEVECRYEQLNFIEEKRLAALSHGQLYQRRLIEHTIKICAVEVSRRRFGVKNDIFISKGSSRKMDS